MFMSLLKHFSWYSSFKFLRPWRIRWSLFAGFTSKDCFTFSQSSKLFPEQMLNPPMIYSMKLKISQINCRCIKSFPSVKIRRPECSHSSTSEWNTVTNPEIHRFLSSQHASMLNASHVLNEGTLTSEKWFIHEDEIQSNNFDQIICSVC